jgi:hypothetical protein
VVSLIVTLSLLGAASPAGEGGAGARADFWAFQRVEMPEVPRVSRDDRPRNPIDCFILARLEKEGLAPVPSATKRVLIRRATFDLIGLPPRPEEVDAFVLDDSPDAFAKVVDRLLGSKEYGERWGRHWLDLVRYADTAGDAADFPVPEAYKYRNWVIDSFAHDETYDEFVRQQIAGDLLPAVDDDQRWQQTIATGYIAISRRIGVSPHKLRHITIESTIDNLGKTFLGLTIGCARCHDHKFDRIPTSDYYAFYGIFDSSVYPHAGAEHQPYRRDFVYRVGKAKADEILRPFRETLAPWDLREREALRVYRLFQTEKVDDPKLTRESTWAALLQVREQRAAVARTFPDLEIAHAIQDGESRDAHVMKGGDPSGKAKGALARRGFLQVLGGRKLPEEAHGSGRVELAGWLADGANPLTARVMANRIWHHHFGRGIVATTSDFGVRGSPPSHPELLDYLAARFVDSGWSVKAMHRLMVLSETYRLGNAESARNSHLDPENRLLWRSNRVRLDAEQLRDSLLSLSGRLDASIGQRHAFPHRLTYFYRQHEPFSETYSTNRRSVYMLQRRLEKDSFLDLFDGPDGNLHVGERGESTTTLQSLYLMNSEFVHDHAGAMASRLLAETGDGSPRRRLDWAYERLFSRRADDQEAARGRQHLSTLRTIVARSEGASADIERLAWSAYLRSMVSSNEFLFVD